MKRTVGIALLGALAMVGGGGEARPGGVLPDTDDRAAFSAPVQGLDGDQGLEFRVGAAVVAKLWSSAPSSTRSSDGLGPLYNARSCLGCHTGHGRAPLPQAGAPGPGLVLRLDDDPVYGRQLQTRAVQGLAAEGRLGLRYETISLRLADGAAVSLRRPRYSIENPAYGPPRAGLGLSPRQAPPLIGMGLLAAIPDAAILAGADPDDRDGDGVSGRPNWLAASPGGRRRLGRFGWKAGHADLAGQVASAFVLDLGLSSPDQRRSFGDCTVAQRRCRQAATGDDPHEGVEVVRAMLDVAVFHIGHLAVPPPAEPPAEGARLFASLGCAACHRPSFRTPDGAIRPYSDLLLHDMGPALADTMSEGGAKPGEWRTAPLWGLGRAERVGGAVGFLHDGRARDPLEAVLWHGGEAAPARDRVMALDAASRAALIAFLKSL